MMLVQTSKHQEPHGVSDRYLGINSREECLNLALAGTMFHTGGDPRARSALGRGIQGGSGPEGAAVRRA